MAKKAVSPSDAALTRVRAICGGFAGADEKLSNGLPSFHVRGKMFLHFAANHHGDGKLAVWCKSTLEQQRALVAAHPDRYFVPPYVGFRGWVGARLDVESTDWLELAIVVEEGWLAVAPKTRAASSPVTAARDAPHAKGRARSGAGASRRRRPS